MYWKVYPPKIHRTFYNPVLGSSPRTPDTFILTRVDVLENGKIISAIYFRQEETKKSLAGRLKEHKASTFMLVHFYKIKKEVDKRIVKEIL